MPYSLSFSPEFFFAEGEPYDRNGFAVNEDGNPTSVYSALCMMPEEQWAEMIQDLFQWDLDPDYFPVETIIDLVYQTNTCSNLTIPVEVWIDEDGEHTVKVWE